MKHFRDDGTILGMMRLFWPLPLALFSAFFLPWGLAPPKREKIEKTKPMAKKLFFNIEVNLLKKASQPPQPPQN